MKTSMRNPRTGEVVDVRVGFDWTLFLSSWFLGVPLFLRKLNVWGAFMLALWALIEVGPRPAPNTDDEIGYAILWLGIYAGMSLYFGIKGRELTVKNYLDLGWPFVDPTSEETKAAKLTWGIKL